MVCVALETSPCYFSQCACLSWHSCNLVSADFNYDHLSPIFLIIAQPCVAQTLIINALTGRTVSINVLPILCVSELVVKFKTTLFCFVCFMAFV